MKPIVNQLKLNIMKRILLALVIVTGILADTSAQQIPLYSQYYLNPFVYNPARTGDRGNLHANLIYRAQWTAIQGAPEAYAATLDGAIQDQKAGFGALFYNDNISVFRRFGGYLSYAYHIKINEDHKL